MIRYSRLLKILVVAVVLGFYASFLIVKINLPAADNDAGLYVADGRVIWETKNVFNHNIYSYVETDYPFVNSRWLASVVFYLVTRFAGFAGLSIFKIVVYLSAFGLLFWVATKKADFWLVALLSLPTILILSQRSRIRPEMFSYLFIAAFLYFLIDLEKHPERKRIFWLVPLELLWVNFHIFFFLGIVLVAGFLFEKIVLNINNFWRQPIVKKLALIIPILILVCFVNPNGLNGVLAPIRSHSYATFMVSENLPLFNLNASFFAWNIFGSAFMPMVFAFLLSLFFGFKSFGVPRLRSGQAAGSTALTKSQGKPIFYLLACLSTAGAGIIQVRLVTLFALMFLPGASANFNAVYLKIQAYLKRKWRRVAMTLGYALAFGVVAAFPYEAYRINASVIGQGYTTDWGVGLSSSVNNAAEFFKENNLKGPIFNDYDIGGYIIYHLFPKEKVFVDDNGADAYPVSFFDGIFMPALSQEDKWQETEQKYNLNAIFISVRDGSPSVGNFIWNRLHDPSWALVYTDSYFVIFLKNVPENQDIINKYQITKDNIQEKIGYMLESKDVTDRLIASRTFYLIGQESLAMSTLKKVVARYPTNSGVWYYMGAIKVMANDPASVISATVFLENAVNMGEKTSDAYTSLGLAYFRISQFDKAKDAFQKALWYDPGRQDTTNYLIQLNEYIDSHKN